MMNIAIGMAIGIFIIVWIWIAFELAHAPEYDENGFPIKKKQYYGRNIINNCYARSLSSGIGCIIN